MNRVNCENTFFRFRFKPKRTHARKQMISLFEHQQMNKTWVWLNSIPPQAEAAFFLTYSLRMVSMKIRKRVKDNVDEGDGYGDGESECECEWWESAREKKETGVEDGRTRKKNRGELSQKILMTVPVDISLERYMMRVHPLLKQEKEIERDDNVCSPTDFLVE